MDSIVLRSCRSCDLTGVDGCPRRTRRPVAVCVELGELAVDVDRASPVEMDVLMMSQSDVGENGVIDVTPLPAQSRDGEAVILRRSRDHRVRGDRQAPHLLSLLLVMPTAERSLAGEGQGAAQRVQVLALIQMAPDPPPVCLVCQVARCLPPERSDNGLLSGTSARRNLG